MRRLKLFSALIVMILAFSYFMLATYQAPMLAKQVFKEPHWLLETKHLGLDPRAVGFMDFRCFDVLGNLLWEEIGRPNNLADEGEYMFLDVVLRAGTAPTNFYLRLYNDTPVETDNLTSITGEPSTNGYAAQLVERNTTGWPTLALDSGDHRAVSTTETFTASGGSWGPVIYCVLATTSDNSGKHVSFVALSQSRTLASGESLQVTYRLKQQ